MKDYFKNKKITVMGLGLLGRGVGDVEFLAENRADLLVTDLKNKKELKTSLNRLKKFKNIKYVLGKHRLQDFKNRDMILKSADVKPNSIYIKEAKKNKIPIEMSASLFAKLSSAVIIGITGTRGKSTTTQMIYEILKLSPRTVLGEREVFLGGNVKGVSTLALLNKTKDKDIVVMELDSWQLQGFGESKISPHIAVFTNLMRDHMNYYKNNIEKYFNDKVNIFKYQKENDYLIVGKNIARKIMVKHTKVKPLYLLQQRTVLCVPKSLPKDWKLKIIGEHNRENAEFATAVAEIIGVPKNIIKKTIENFKGVPGRLEYLRTVREIKIYNDTTATTPEAVIIALNSLKEYKSRIILIGGGADKNLEYDEYTKVVKKYVKNLILFKGGASEKIIFSLNKIDKIKFPINLVDNMKKAISIAKDNAKAGDIILLSPGSASFGIFKNEYDRGEQFNKLVKNL